MAVDTTLGRGEGEQKRSAEPATDRLVERFSSDRVDGTLRQHVDRTHEQNHHPRDLEEGGNVLYQFRAIQRLLPARAVSRRLFPILATTELTAERKQEEQSDDTGDDDEGHNGRLVAKVLSGHDQCC